MKSEKEMLTVCQRLPFFLELQYTKETYTTRKRKETSKIDYLRETPLPEPLEKVAGSNSSPEKHPSTPNTQLPVRPFAPAFTPTIPLDFAGSARVHRQNQGEGLIGVLSLLKKPWRRKTTRRLSEEGKNLHSGGSRRSDW